MKGYQWPSWTNCRFHATLGSSSVRIALQRSQEFRRLSSKSISFFFHAGRLNIDRANLGPVYAQWNSPNLGKTSAAKSASR
jgi:hypothetical protein